MQHSKVLIAPILNFFFGPVISAFRGHPGENCIIVLDDKKLKGESRLIVINCCFIILPVDNIRFINNCPLACIQISSR